MPCLTAMGKDVQSSGTQPRNFPIVLLEDLIAPAQRRHLLWLLGLLCLLVAVYTPVIASENIGAEARTPMIVVVKGRDNLQKLREMCLERITDDGEGASLFHGLPDDCHIAGACKRIFTSSIKGVCGDFTNAEVDTIERCLEDGIEYLELDGVVSGIAEVSPEAPKRLSILDILNSGEDKNTEDQGFSQGDKLDPLLLPRYQLSDPGHPLSTHGGNADGQGLRQQGLNDAMLAEVVGRPGTKVQSVHEALWNLDRVDQRELPLNKEYRYGGLNIAGTGRGTTVFILDSGIRPLHQEFSGWGGEESRAKYGWDFVDDDPTAEDCNGHGTLVASTAIGRTVGLAKEAEVVAVRVLDCHGSGNISRTVAGLDWVASNHKKPGVVTLSLEVPVGRWSRSLEDAVRSLIKEHGLTVVVASGNDAIDSCAIAPANVPETITVAGSDLATKFLTTAQGEMEGIYNKSNTGSCVDIFAPGVDIYAACGGLGRCQEVTDDAYIWASGTSMAVPHVAGVAAVYLGEFPQASPAEVKLAIVSRATMNKIDSSLLLEGTPNRLLYSNVFEECCSTHTGPSA